MKVATRYNRFFSINETTFYWKKMPSRTFMTREKKSTPGFIASKDRLTVSLAAKAAGDSVETNAHLPF